MSDSAYQVIPDEQIAKLTRGGLTWALDREDWHVVAKLGNLVGKGKTLFLAVRNINPKLVL